MLSVLLMTAIAFAAPSDWQGEYALNQSSDGDEEVWHSSLSIGNCIDKTCRYSFSSGSAVSMCSAEGEFRIQSAGKAMSKQEACVVTFERRKNAAVFVDAEGDCNSLCGAQGARYFAVLLPKVSQVKFFSPSFSCTATKLSKIETAICTSGVVSKLDQELAALVREKKTPLKDQRAWIKSRDSKCAKTDLVKCLESVYRERLQALKR